MNDFNIALYAIIYNTFDDIIDGVLKEDMDKIKMQNIFTRCLTNRWFFDIMLV